MAKKESQPNAPSDARTNKTENKNNNSQTQSKTDNCR
jgi:hypothetical protein